ncbi:HAD-IIIC family phosphatase [Streptomyces sp. DW26H14]|uniref:HAD-IIIC family phosphatase n=1 Tax=Streptomyces sp. DW26H14 TaxID=3435395 RepID=UPI00403DA71D
MSELIDALRATVAEGRAPAPALRAELARGDDPAVLRRAGRALAGLKDPAGELRPVSVAVVAACTVGPYETLLRARLVGAGALPAISAAPYGAFDLTLATGGFDSGSDLVACLLDADYFLPADLDFAAPESAEEHLRDRLRHLRALAEAALSKNTATVVLHTVPLPGTVSDTVLSLRARGRLSRMWYELNAGLLEMAETSDGRIQVIDLVGLLADRGVAARDERLHAYADLPYTDGALLLLADGLRRIAQARAGLSRKVLAVDLDNTLWGGVLGEVGAEGVVLGGLYPGKSYQALQRTVRALRDQGVILVLASKNDADAVTAALTEHPDVLLRPEAFSFTAVNWSSKGANLAEAAETLGLGTQSMVFMDDSPFERGEVEALLPEVTLIDAGGDPAYLSASLVRGGLFDVTELTGTDRKRPELYRARGLRKDFSGSFASPEEYLSALEIRVTVEAATPFNVPRIVQLGARTNQFNLTGLRFDAAETKAMIAGQNHLVAAISARDRFGDEGIVGAVWVEQAPDAWHVLNLVLSCRVLGRGVEFAIAGLLAELAREAGAARLTGAFTPSPKNAVAAGFWEKAGFEAEGEGRFVFVPGQSPDPTPSWIVLDGSVREGRNTTAEGTT